MKRLSILALLIGCAPAEKPVAPVAPQPDAEPRTCALPPHGDAPPGQYMPMKLVETHRIAGVLGLAPKDLTKEHMHEEGIAAVRAEVRMCLDEAGVPNALRMNSGTCVKDYDASILERMAEWRYKPFEINGKPAGICTDVTFVYRQSNVRAAGQGTVTF